MMAFPISFVFRSHKKS
ncbi:hypothetical protein ZWY2020_060062 [Hordeum vulgare]|nr:hypothetical protein ZWY2020_060062 [Hordeum vulgare]